VAREFLSQGWFALANELTADLPPRAGSSYRVQYESSSDGATTVWHQEVEDGRVARWAIGPLPTAELVVRWSAADALAVHRGERSGSEALAAMTVAGRDGSGALVSGPPAPLDIAETEELARLPFVPEATLVIQYRFERGPFGPVDYWWSFVDGRSAGMGLGLAPEADVGVTISYANMVGVRTGRMTILEALDHGGQATGDVGTLMLLAGLEESEELHAAELACGPSGPVLAAMGELAATPAYEAARAALAAGTR
jgi:hypothetical protein